MDAGRTTDPLTDSALEHEIEKTLAVDPSPEFVARVRVRVASEPMRGAWGFSLKLAGVGIAVTAIVVVAVSVPWQGPQSPPTVPRAGVSHEPAPVPSPGQLFAPSGQPSASAQARSRFVQRRPEPEVLISPEESAALRQLFTDISRGRFEPASLPDVEPVSPLMSIMEIAIEPIAVDPLTPLGSE